MKRIKKQYDNNTEIQAKAYQNELDIFVVDLWKRSETKRLNVCFNYIDKSLTTFLSWDTNKVSFYEVMNKAESICFDLNITPSKENKMMIIEHMFELCNMISDNSTVGGITRQEDEDF